MGSQVKQNFYILVRQLESYYQDPDSDYRSLLSELGESRATPVTPYYSGATAAAGAAAAATGSSHRLTAEAKRAHDDDSNGRPKRQRT